MRQQLRDYIISERFIHDGLLKKAELLVKKLYDFWKKDRRIESSVLLWPAVSIKADDGGKIDIVVMSLEGMGKHQETLRNAVDRVGAYAIFYVKQEGDEVRAILESPHGTRSWTMPIYRSADVNVLGAAKILDDRDYVGLLWSPKQGQA